MRLAQPAKGYVAPSPQIVCSRRGSTSAAPPLRLALAARELQFGFMHADWFFFPLKFTRFKDFLVSDC